MSRDLSRDLPEGFTLLLSEAAKNNPQAAAAALTAAYKVLKQEARRRLQGERRDHTVSATDLVHEVAPKLFAAFRGPHPDSVPTDDAGAPNGPGSPQDAKLGTGWADRHHFVAAAASAMRNFLIDYARSRGRQKRDAGGKRVNLDTVSVADLARRADPDQIIALDEAFCRLQQEHSQPGQIVLLKFYAGLSSEQTAEALGISPKTVKRKWKFARAYLANILREQP